MSEPQIIMGDAHGVHNASLDASAKRLLRARSYRDLSTVCVIPVLHRGIPARVVERWMGMMVPMNQKFVRIFMEGMEVGEAYERAVELILGHPELGGYRYLLTVEHDNLPPPDGLLRLYEHIDDYAAVGGLYWTKGPEGQPMIYGDPMGGVLDFVPQVPVPDTIQECNGLGMGFTLFRLDVFRQIERPWFQTLQSYEPGVGVRMYTQDLHYFEKVRRAGFKVACDTRVKVGHYDHETGMVW